MTSTELGYLSGVTSNIQDQLNGKALSTHDHTGQIISPAFIYLNRTNSNQGVIFTETHELGNTILDISANNGIRVWNSDKKMLWIDSNPDEKIVWVNKLRLNNNNYGDNLPSTGGSISGVIFFLKST